MIFTRYNPATDRMEARIEVCGGKGIYFLEVPVIEGRSFRKDKAEALAAIDKAIRSGKAPGEVKT